MPPAALRIAAVRRVLRREPALPGQRVGNDAIEIVALRSPAKLAAARSELATIAVGVAGPPSGHADLEIAAMDAANAVDHLKHRIAMAVAAIGDEAAAAGAQTLQAPGDAPRPGR